MKSEAPEMIYLAFDEERDELIWLASFLLANEKLIGVCFLDAFEICLRGKAASRESAIRSSRRAVIESAFEMQQSRVAVLSTIYQRRGCSHEQHESISSELLKLLTAQSPEALLRLDVLCRFALALRGVEEYSATESASILGISLAALESAYCAGQEALHQLAHGLLQVCDDDGQMACN